MFRQLCVVTIGFSFSALCMADDGYLGVANDDSAATARGDILEGRAELAESLGRRSLLRSLSAKQFQEAIDKRLGNRKERVEMYYDLKDMREEELEEDRMSASQRRRIIKARTPDRLNEGQIDRGSGELFWPAPLDHEALKPYRKPIEDSLSKRGSPGEVYREFDYLKVHRMVKRMEEAVDSIKDKLDVKEVVALKDYLAQIDYEARFDMAGERIDY